MKWISLIAATSMLCACVTQQQWVDRQVGADKPQEYKDGYVDGCSSGNKAAGAWGYKFKKNIDLFKSDDNYKIGWDDGFSVCKGKQESLERSLR